MIWRRKGLRAGSEPEKVLAEARATLGDLHRVLADFRSHLDELEAEVYRQPEPLEGGVADA